jgi:hypothetical protein
MRIVNLCTNVRDIMNGTTREDVDEPSIFERYATSPILRRRSRRCPALSSPSSVPARVTGSAISISTSASPFFRLGRGSHARGWCHLRPLLRLRRPWGPHRMQPWETGREASARHASWSHWGGLGRAADASSWSGGSNVLRKMTRSCCPDARAAVATLSCAISGAPLRRAKD